MGEIIKNVLYVWWVRLNWTISIKMDELWSLFGVLGLDLLKWTTIQHIVSYKSHIKG